MWKMILKAACLAAGLTLAVTQAHASKIDEFTFAEKTQNHDIHVRFDRTQNNWTTALSRKVTFKLDYYLKVYSLSPINPNESWISMRIKGVEGQGEIEALNETRHNPGIAYPHVQWKGVQTFSFPADKLGLSGVAVGICQKLYSQGKRPDRSHRIFIAQVQSEAKVIVENYSPAVFAKTATKTATSYVHAVCDKDPDWKPPARAGNPIEIVNVAVHPKGTGESCPKPYDLKVTFRSKAPKVVRFRIRTSEGVSGPYHVTLEKDGGFYQARYVKTYTLDPGESTFQVLVNDGPTSEKVATTATCPQFKVISSLLKYSDPGAGYCPKSVTETAIFRTTRPGWVRYRIVHQGGLVVAEGKVTAKRVGDHYEAVATRKLTFNSAFEAEMKAEVTNQTSASSGWTTLKVDCLKMIGAQIEMADPYKKAGAKQCPRKARVKVQLRFNQAGAKVKYQVKCSNGFSRIVERSVRKNRVHGDYRILGAYRFDVNQSGTIACSLIDMDNGKVLDFTGHDYDCVKRAVDTSPGPGLTVAPKPQTEVKPVVTAQPQIETQTPKCTTAWKTTCSPVRKTVCVPVIKQHCEVVPHKTCRQVASRVCTPVRKQVCETVRGRRVCRVKMVRDCKASVKNVCTVTRDRKCSSVVQQNCTTQTTQSCRRTKVENCTR